MIAMKDQIRVLLVEDDPEDFMITRDLISDIDDASYSLEWRNNYDAGLGALSEGGFGACLLDFRLGERSGLEFLRAAQQWGNVVPIILFTNHVDRAMEREALSAGAADHLPKTGTSHENLRRALRFAMERNHLANAAREGDKLFRAIFDNALDAMLITDAQGRFIDVNAAASTLTGLRRAELLGQTLAQLVPRNGDPAQAAARWAGFLEAGRSSGALELFRPDGSSRHVEFSGTCNILPQRHLYVLHDISKQKALQARMAISDRMASVGTLAAGLAHEINNPLAAVVGYLDMAVEALRADGMAVADGQALEFLGHAGEAAQRVSMTVKDLKLFSGSGDGRTAAVELSTTIESSLRMAWNEIRHRAKVVKSYGEVPLVGVNESRLGQVFLNLLVNAAQAIPPGRVDENQISVSIRTAGEHIVVEIKDTGSGIPPHDLEKIFDAFYSTKAAHLGTGLGLAICKGMVEDMGGQIMVTSELGHGSSFSLLLPLSLACSPPQAAPEPLAMAHGRRGRVLIVDDEVSLLNVMRSVLSREHEAVTVQDPRQALQRLVSGEIFDAILCDMMMPEMTGLEFYTKLLAAAPHQAHRLIFVTGGAFTMDERDFMTSSGIRCLEKPFGMKELSAQVRAVVGA